MGEDVVVAKHQRPDEEHAHGPSGQRDHRLEFLDVEVPTHRGLHPSSRAATALEACAASGALVEARARKRSPDRHSDAISVAEPELGAKMDFA
jgi:hypothetical protein